MFLKQQLIAYLAARRLPLEDEQAALHAALQGGAPELYAALLRDPAAHVTQKREVLARVLIAARAGADFPRARLLHALWALPRVEGLAVAEVLRERRFNGRRGRSLGLRFLLGHPRLTDLAATRRQRVVRLLRHLLGERTWASARRHLSAPSEEGQRFLQRTLLRHARDVGLARQALCFLAGVPFQPSDPILKRSLAARRDLSQGRGLPRATLAGLRATFHPTVPLQEARSLAEVVPRSATTGPLTAVHLEVLASGEPPTPEQQGRIVERQLQVQSELPALPGRIDLILDLSTSMGSSGQRRNHPAALGLALTRLLQACCEQLVVHQVAGSRLLDEELVPAPRGEGDLALALLEAGRSQPDLILILTDGYENRRQGDVDSVARGLRQLNPELAVYQIVPRFTRSEDLTQRRLGEAIPILPLDREEGVREVAAHAVLAQEGDEPSRAGRDLLEELLCLPS